MIGHTVSRDTIVSKLGGGGMGVVYRGEVDRAFEWLERAYAQRDSGLSQIKGHPHFKRLERDPRYAALLEKMHLPL
jgi:hypothetical protein